MSAEPGQPAAPPAGADEAAPWPASAQAAELTPAPAGDGADEQEEEEEEDEEDEEAGEEAAGAAAAEHPALGPAVDADGNPLVAPPNPYNLGTIKGWTYPVLATCGKKGMRAADVLEAALAKGLVVNTKMTPEGSIVSSLTMDTNFTRVGPRRYALTFFIVDGKPGPYTEQQSRGFLERHPELIPARPRTGTGDRKRARSRAPTQADMGGSVFGEVRVGGRRPRREAALLARAGISEAVAATNLRGKGRMDGVVGVGAAAGVGLPEEEAAAVERPPSETAEARAAREALEPFRRPQPFQPRQPFPPFTAPAETGAKEGEGVTQVITGMAVPPLWEHVDGVALLPTFLLRHNGFEVFDTRPPAPAPAAAPAAAAAAADGVTAMQVDCAPKAEDAAAAAAAAAEPQPPPAFQPDLVPPRHSLVWFDARTGRCWARSGRTERSVELNGAALPPFTAAQLLPGHSLSIDASDYWRGEELPGPVRVVIERALAQEIAKAKSAGGTGGVMMTSQPAALERGLFKGLPPMALPPPLARKPVALNLPPLSEPQRLMAEGLDPVVQEGLQRPIPPNMTVHSWREETRDIDAQRRQFLFWLLDKESGAEVLACVGVESTRWHPKFTITPAGAAFSPRPPKNMVTKVKREVEDFLGACIGSSSEKAVAAVAA